MTPILRLAALLVCAALVGGDPRSSAADSMPSWAYTKDAGPSQDRAKHLIQLGAAAWHAAGVRGAGVKVAVLDSGFRGYRDHLGKSLPTAVAAKSFRKDGNLEAKDSQHGILCGEVVHAIAPEAGLLFANWEADDPDAFLRAVRWARNEGAKVMTCSIIMPGWSDGEGNGPIHQKLREILGDGTHPNDPLLFSCAGNVAQRSWAGDFRPNADGHHQWADSLIANPVTPWGDDKVSLELRWSDAAAKYGIDVVDAVSGQPVPDCTRIDHADRLCVVARFKPVSDRSYAVRLRQEKGKPGRFHFTSLHADLGSATLRGSIPFPGDGPEVVTIGAVNAADERASFSACGPNSARPKPDLVAPIPFGSFWRAKPFSGTSAATPQAAGVAALRWSSQPRANAVSVQAAMLAEARDLGPKGHDFETGHGRVALPRPRSPLDKLR